MKRPTDCTFGGDELEDLYITTRREVEGESPGAGSRAGSVFRTTIPGIRGLSHAWHWGKPEPWKDSEE